MKDMKKLEAILKSLEDNILLLEEVAERGKVGDLPFVTKKIQKNRDDLTTYIHGSGTGNN